MAESQIRSSDFKFDYINRESDWKGVFDTIDANFSKVANYLSTLGSRVHIETFTAEADQTNFTLSSIYNTRKNSLAVYINGARQWLGEGFLESSESSFTLRKPSQLGDQIVAVYNQYYLLTDNYPLDSLILRSPNGSQYRITIDNDGNLRTSDMII